MYYILYGARKQNINFMESCPRVVPRISRTVNRNKTRDETDTAALADNMYNTAGGKWIYMLGMATLKLLKFYSTLLHLQR